MKPNDVVELDKYSLHIIEKSASSSYLFTIGRLPHAHDIIVANIDIVMSTKIVNPLFLGSRLFQRISVTLVFIQEIEWIKGEGGRRSIGTSVRMIW